MKKLSLFAVAILSSCLLIPQIAYESNGNNEMSISTNAASAQFTTEFKQIMP